jgi:hypothetical protein
LQPSEPPQLEQYIYQNFVGGQRLEVPLFIGEVRTSGMSPGVAYLENGSEGRVRRKREREVEQGLL